MILTQKRFFGEENVIMNMPISYRFYLKPVNIEITAHTWDTEVLCFEADELAKLLKNENSSYDWIIKLY